MSSRPVKGWVQVVVVLCFAVLVLAVSWVTQYAITHANQQPRAAGAPAPR